SKRKRSEGDLETSSKKSRTAADAPSAENDTNGQSPTNNANSFCASEEAQGTASSDEARNELNFLLRLKTPSECWTKHCFPNLDGVLYCTSTLCEEATVVSERVVTFFHNEPHNAYSKVYIRGRLVEEHCFSSQEEAENLLQKADAFELCVGALGAADYYQVFLTTRIRSQLTERHGMFFSSKCLGKVANKGFNPAHPTGF
ncbi:hypothetical protein MTO96_045096, partial [Rhipicephalus appendiculatus]